MRVALMMPLKWAPPLSLVFLLMISGVVIAQQQWRVYYTPNYICAVRGSNVNVGCSYMYNATNSTVPEAFWSKKVNANSPQRIPNVRITPLNCSLKLKDVTQDNQGKYFLTLQTSEGKRLQGKEVEISVTGLRVEMIPDSVTEGDEILLSCKTTCNLTSTPTFIWYKNGNSFPSVSSSNLVHLPSVSQEDRGDYRCAVQGQSFRSPAVTLNVQEHQSIFPLVIGIIILVVAALLAGLFYMRRKRQKTHHLTTSSLQLSQQNAAEDLYIPPDPTSESSSDVYHTIANIYSSPTDDMDLYAEISSDTNETFANDYYNSTDDTYTNMDLQVDAYDAFAAVDLGSADDTYTALDSASITPDYDTLTTARNQPSPSTPFERERERNDDEKIITGSTLTGE